MCVLIVCEKATPPREWLERAARLNPDGYGYAYPDGQRIRFLRGTGKETLEHVLRVAEKPPAYPLLLHFRFATAGGRVPELAHPFPVPPRNITEGKSEAVVAQNGHHSEWALELARFAVEKRLGLNPRDYWSDTKAMAWILGHLEPRTRKGWLRKMATRWGKVAYMDDKAVYMYGQGWVKYEGYWASCSLEPPVVRKPASGLGTWGECEICGEMRWVRKIEDTSVCYSCEKYFFGGR